MLRTQSAEGEIFETWFMDTVFSGFKSSLSWLLAALKDTS